MASPTRNFFESRWTSRNLDENWWESGRLRWFSAFHNRAQLGPLFCGMVNKILVGGLVAIFYYFPMYIGFLIMPIDELIFFRGLAQPPTSFHNQGPCFVEWWIKLQFKELHFLQFFGLDLGHDVNICQHITHFVGNEWIHIMPYRVIFGRVCSPNWSMFDMYVYVYIYIDTDRYIYIYI